MKSRVLHLIETTGTVADAFEAFAAARGFTLLRHDTDWSAALDFLPLPDDVLIADLDRPDDVRGFLGWLGRLALMPRTILVTSLETGFAAALSAGAKGIVVLAKPIRIDELDAAIVGPATPAAESA
ncbi:hypothetical protein L5876_12790 [Hyphobacterium sp. SN044]|uniref:hypothetical protein n=1 Tax=Hyphobacterium sp. SN044 TaxID=2912575 RepID=UPI001F1C0706|nr:hypothetical protein [Hyphobacterium sp. SN044]MCF8880696.1 hypothetical protein [Hyphobacterium sp. SN044]